MARSIPLRPNPHVPVSADAAKDVLGAAISAHIRATGVTAAEISRRYKSVRAGDIGNILAGDHRLYGINRLMSLCEAMGLRPVLTVSA